MALAPYQRVESLQELGSEGWSYRMGPEWIVVGIVAVVVLFGAKKLPEMARSVGRAQGEFKKGLKEGVQPEPDEPSQASAPAPEAPKATEPDPGSGTGTAS